MTTETTQATPPEPAGPRRLTRSSSDRVIAGVCGGLGRYLGIDAVVCRLIFIVLLFFGGAGVIAYLAAWVIVPRDDAPADRGDARTRARRALIVLAVLAVTGLFALAGAWAAALGGGTVVAVVVILGGVALVAGGLLGGLRWLIAPVLALALAAGLVSAANVDARGGVGQRIYRPHTSADLRPSYRLGVGRLLLDLRFAHLTPSTHHVSLRMGMGQIEIYVPQDVCVSTQAHVGIGGTEVFDRSNGGVDVDVHDTQGAPAKVARLVVDAKVGLGGLRIEPTEDGTYPGNARCAHA